MEQFSGREMKAACSEFLKCMAEMNFYSEQFSGRVGCFEEITVLIVQLNGLREVCFD